MALNVAEASTIGFNDSLQVAGVTLHLQTEVAKRGALVVRTTVLEGGVVKWMQNLPVPDEVSDMPALVALVRAQHGRYVDHLKRTGASWLASI